MRYLLPLLLSFGCSPETTTSDPSSGSSTGNPAGNPGGNPGGNPVGTPSGTTLSTAPSGGCGLGAQHAEGGALVWIDAGAAGDGQRSLWLTLPPGYDPNQPHRLVVAYAGTSFLGEWMVPYLQLENTPTNEDFIFVYPDPLWRDFDGWGNLGGWLLGPHAHPASGDQDLVFTEAMLDWVEDNYCIDSNRVFATGHSWGGDMAMVASCYLGDRLTASIPVAANEPYWFQDGSGGWVDCAGQTDVWTMFGIADDHFTWQDYPGEFGDSCVDFWIDEHSCDGADSWSALPYGDGSECVTYEGCSAGTAYCLYGSEFGHQIPDYYPVATLDFFGGY